MWRFLGSVLLMACMSVAVAEDEPLPLDHADAMTMSEERRVSSKKTFKSVRGKYVTKNKNAKVVAKKDGSKEKVAIHKKSTQAPVAAKRKSTSKKARGKH